MGPTGFFTLLIGTSTFLFASAFPQPSEQAYLPALNSGVSSKAQLQNIQQRMSQLENNFDASRTVVNKLSGFYSALGFQLNDKEEDNFYKRISSRDLCGQENAEGQSETAWTVFGRTKCVKFLKGLANYADATSLCRQQYITGVDIDYPKVATSFDSGTAMNLRNQLKPQAGVTSAWLVVGSTLTSGFNCSSLDVSGADLDVMSAMNMNRVDCAELRGVVCEKPIPIPYWLVVEGLMEARTELEKTHDEIKQLGEDNTSQVESLRAEIAQLGNGSPLQMNKLTKEVALLKETLEKLQKTSKKDNSAMERRLTELETNTQTVFEEPIPTQEVATTPTEWEVNDQEGLNVAEAMGTWHSIEEYGLNEVYSVEPCENFNFELSGKTINTTYRVGRSGDAEEGKEYFNVDTESPNQWIDGDYVHTWVRTDYATWGIFMQCTADDTSNCTYLRILSRNQTLPPMTLEFLRDAVEELGFPREHAVSVDQTEC